MVANNRLNIFMDAALICVVFILVNIRSIVSVGLFPPVDTLTSVSWIEIMLWCLLAPVFVYLIIKNNLIKDYLHRFKVHPGLIIFLIYSFVSILWSDMWLVTLQRSLVFIFATLFAVYVGVRFQLPEFLDILFVLGSVIMFFSYLLIYVNPAIGTDQNYPYNGSWRGIFWHRNHLGAIMALFSMVFLVKIFRPNHVAVRAIACFIYILSLIMVYYAASAAGHILVVLLHLIVGMLIWWAQIRHTMKMGHYVIIVFVLLFLFASVIPNLDFFLGFFNRNSTFTGRTNLWNILLRDVSSQKPWFGYGFGTIWASEEFRVLLQRRLGWPYQVMIGDNGFIDILLNLGIVGLLLFLYNYFQAWYKSSRLLWNSNSIVGLFPMVFMIYTLFANVTFSLFMELEVFIWVIMVVFMMAQISLNTDMSFKADM